MGVSVDLELGPVASVTDEMRKAVAGAFRDAGLDFNWTRPPGGWRALDREKTSENSFKR